MGLVGAVREMSITVEQQARAARYEDALTAFQQGKFSVAYQLAGELLQETPDDLATARLRDMANEKCMLTKSMPSSSMTRTSASSTFSEQDRQHDELIATTASTK
jgi:predicted Zn-dependent protease